MKHSARVAILLDGEMTIHMGGVIGDYHTLCGLDGDDLAIGHELMPHQGPARINCINCRLIWRHARAYSDADFDPGNRE